MSEPAVQRGQRGRITHELKTWPEYFVHSQAGRKRFELRLNDRDFRVGDELILKEWDPKAEYGAEGTPVGFTGRAVKVRVDYIMSTEQITRFTIPPECQDKIIPDQTGFVIMSVSLI